jgi:hypothetical protein
LQFIDDNNNSALNRRRSTTIVHCLRNLPSATISNPSSSTVNSNLLFSRRSISDEIERLPIETSKPTISETSSITMAGVEDEKINSMVLTQNPMDEQQPLPAYIVETC